MDNESKQLNNLQQGPGNFDAIGFPCIPFSPLTHLEEYENRFPDIMDVFCHAHIHPTKSSPLSNPYIPGNGVESFQNIGEHCIAVAWAAKEITAALYDAGRIPNGLIRQVEERALLHDVFKAFEIMYNRALSSGLGNKELTIAPDKLLFHLLRSAGTKSYVLQKLLGAGKEVGHRAIKDLAYCDQQGNLRLYPKRVLDKVLFLADAMTCTGLPSSDSRASSFFTSSQQRIISSRFSEKYPYLFWSGLSAKADGTLTEITDIKRPENGNRVIGSYAALQMRVSLLIAEEFKEAIKPDFDDDGEALILALLSCAGIIN